ncbi:unnamed protein product [Gordionus sp. m RMFG-2023]
MTRDVFDSPDFLNADLELVHAFITHEYVKPLTPMILEFLLKWAKNRCVVHCKPVSSESVINTLNENGFKIMTYIKNLNFIDFREIILKRKVLDDNSLIDLFSEKMRNYEIDLVRPFLINLEISMHCHKFNVNSSKINTFPTRINVCQKVYLVGLGCNLNFGGIIIITVKDGDQICHKQDINFGHISSLTKNPNIESLYYYELPLIPLYQSYNCIIDLKKYHVINSIEVMWNGKALKMISITPDTIFNELFYI